MLMEWMMQAGLKLLDLIYSLTGVLPEFSAEVISAVDTVFNVMFSGISLVSIFIDIRMVKILIPFVIAILNFDKIAKVTMFIIKKIPLINIK